MHAGAIERSKRLIEQQRIASGLPDRCSVVLKTVATILASFGIEDEDRKRPATAFIIFRGMQSYTFKAVITVIVTGFVGAVWLGIKATLGK